MVHSQSSNGLIFTWWGCCGLCLCHKPTELAHSFLFRSCICFYLYGPFDCISFHQVSKQLSVFLLCSSNLISSSFVLSIICLFMKVSFSPDIIPNGWLGLKHQLTSVFGRLVKQKYRIKTYFQIFKLYSVQNMLFSVLHTQYYTSMITDRIRRHEWAFVLILDLVVGLCPVGPCLVGFCWKSVGWYSSNLSLHIKMSPNCAAFSVACAPLSVHITPIVMSAPLTAAKARIPCKRMPLSQRHHLPHSCESPRPPTAVLPFSTTPPRYRHQPPTTPTL